MLAAICMKKADEPMVTIFGDDVRHGEHVGAAEFEVAPPAAEMGDNPDGG